MFEETNKFGTGTLYESEDLKGHIYITCCACMSIYSEVLTWANFHKNRIVKTPDEANTIIVLSCQVTDLAVLNDLRTLENLMDKYGPEKEYFIGGCLARRFDIPFKANRLENIKKDHTILRDMSLVNFQKPFWVNDFKEDGGDGTLFRDMYPLRIGTGCKKKCKYCTIRITRGESTQLEGDATAFEFMYARAMGKDVVLIADSPEVWQMFIWHWLATEYNQPLSIRNLEPSVAMTVSHKLKEMSDKGLLKTLHVPIQSTNFDLLTYMNRDAETTLKYIDFIKTIDREKTKVATNIIVDYDTRFPNPTLKDMEIFDSFVWNPYWDGVWDREKAEKRFDYYITQNKFTMD